MDLTLFKIKLGKAKPKLDVKLVKFCYIKLGHV